MAFFSNWFRADVYKERRTGIEFPASIEGFKRGDITPYEPEPGSAGVAIQYRSEDVEVTVYLRAVGKEAGKTSDEFLRESLAGIKLLEQQGQYSNVKIYGFDPEKERPSWKSAAFTSSSTNRFIASFIHCKAGPEYFVKIRATTGKPESALDSFTRTLQELIDNPPKKP